MTNKKYDSRKYLMLIWNESTRSMRNPPDHRQAGLSIMRTQRRLSRSTRGQWNDSTELGMADR